MTSVEHQQLDVCDNHAKKENNTLKHCGKKSKWIKSKNIIVRSLWELHASVFPQYNSSDVESSTHTIDNTTGEVDTTKRTEVNRIANNQRSSFLSRIPKEIVSCVEKYILFENYTNVKHLEHSPSEKQEKHQDNSSVSSVPVVESQRFPLFVPRIEIPHRIELKWKDSVTFGTKGGRIKLVMVTGTYSINLKQQKQVITHPCWVLEFSTPSAPSKTTTQTSLQIVTCNETQYNQWSETMSIFKWKVTFCDGERGIVLYVKPLY